MLRVRSTQAESWMQFFISILEGFNGSVNRQARMSDAYKFTCDDSLGCVFGVE